MQRVVAWKRETPGAPVAISPLLEAQLAAKSYGDSAAARVGGFTASIAGSEVFSGTIAAAVGGFSSGVAASYDEPGTYSPPQRVLAWRREVPAAPVRVVLGLGSLGLSSTTRAALNVGGFIVASVGSEVFSGTIAANVGGFTVAATSKKFSGAVTARVGGFSTSEAASFDEPGTYSPPQRVLAWRREVPAAPVRVVLGLGSLGLSSTTRAALNVGGFVVAGAGHFLNSNIAARVGGFTASIAGSEVFSGAVTARVGGFSSGVTASYDEPGTYSPPQRVLAWRREVPGAPVRVVLGLGSLKAGAPRGSFTAAIAANIGGFVLAAAGSEVFSGAVAANVGRFVVSALANETFPGAISARVGRFVVAAAGSEVFSGAVVARIGGFAVAATSKLFSGAADAHVGGFSVSAHARFFVRLVVRWDTQDTSSLEWVTLQNSSTIREWSTLDLSSPEWVTVDVSE